MCAAFFDMLGSEHLLLGAKLVRYVVLILLVNHYVACGWYAMASFNDGEVTWASALGLEDGEEPGYHYAMSLHWSLTQFSPSTNNIAPTNLTERLFASCIVLVALLVFSSFISSVTNAVNQLRLVNMEPMMEEARIREFMMVRNISTDLFARVQHFFKHAYIKQRVRVRESDLVFFSQMPESMLIQMHLEVYLPKLHLNAVFNHLADLDRSLLRRVCHLAMSEQFNLSGQDIFIDGTLSTGLYFLVSGKLQYERVFTNSRLHPSGTLGKSTRARIRCEDWLAEMSLWVAWIHCGHLLATTPSELVKLESGPMGHIISSHGGPMVACLRTFAVLIVAHFEQFEQQGGVVTDMPMDTDVLEETAKRAIKFADLRKRRFDKERYSQSSDASQSSPRSPRGSAGAGMSRFRGSILVRR